MNNTEKHDEHADDIDLKHSLSFEMEDDEFSHDEFSEKLSIPTRDMWKEHKSIVIDRVQEDKDILEFQKTGDMRLLEKLYNNRIPTLKVWATKHYYPGLTMSQDDLFEELSIVFVKAARRFQKGRANFNTCLFSFLQNRIKNIKNGVHAKKRMPEHYEGPRSGMILSLDYPCGGDGNSDITLKDIIPDPNFNPKKINLDDTVSALSDGDEVIKEFLYKVSNGESISNILVEAKQEEGVFMMPHSTAAKMKSANKKAVKDFLGESKEFGKEFELIEYKLDGCGLHYKVQFRKTEKYETISKAIRNFKRNKQQYLEIIK